jgi:GAF domain
MDPSKFQTYKTKFIILLSIAAIVLLLVLFNFYEILNLNKELLNHRTGISLLMYIFILIVIFVLVCINIYKENKEAKSVSVELSELHRKNLITDSKDTANKSDSDNVEEKSKEADLLEEIWKEIEKEKEIDKRAEQFLIKLSKKFEIVQGLFYLFNKKEKKYLVSAKYAYYSEEEPQPFELGEGLSGQVAKDMIPMNINELPDKYMTILSGLGSSAPNNLLIIPVIKGKDVIGVIELASFVPLNIDLDEFINFLKGKSDKFIAEKKK